MLRAQVRTFTGCTRDNIDSIDAIVPEKLWARAGNLSPCSGLYIQATCPWGSEILKPLPLVHITIVQGGDYHHESIRVRAVPACTALPASCISVVFGSDRNIAVPPRGEGLL